MSSQIRYCRPSRMQGSVKSRAPAFILTSSPERKLKCVGAIVFWGCHHRPVYSCHGPRIPREIHDGARRRRCAHSEGYYAPRSRRHMPQSRFPVRSGTQITAPRRRPRPQFTGTQAQNICAVDTRSHVDIDINLLGALRGLQRRNNVLLRVIDQACLWSVCNACG
jgi:hypothetical protein